MTFAGWLAFEASVTAGAKVSTYICSRSYLCSYLFPLQGHFVMDRIKIGSLSGFALSLFLFVMQLCKGRASLWFPPACLNMSTQLLDKVRKCLCGACSEACQVMPCSPAVVLEGENTLLLEVLRSFLSL